MFGVVVIVQMLSIIIQINLPDILPYLVGMGKA